MFTRIFCVLIVSFFLCSCEAQEPADYVGSETAQIPSESAGSAVEIFDLISAAFADGGMIPAQYTCDGAGISPPLSWGPLPEKTKSIALLVEDPDAPMGSFVHWVMFNMSADKVELSENVPPEGTLPDGTIQGMNDFGNIGYGAPCPPFGTHRYYFNLFALDTVIDLGPGAQKSELMKAMNGHIIGRGTITGRYKKE